MQVNNGLHFSFKYELWKYLVNIYLEMMQKRG
jgi:hypothetical protein